MPIGVIAPIPVTTTRRRMAENDRAVSGQRRARRACATLTLRNASQAGERSRRDPVNEYRSDHRVAAKIPISGQRGPSQTCTMRTCVPPSAGVKLHSTSIPVGDTADVAESDCRRRVIDLHLRQPPRRPVRRGRTDGWPTSRRARRRRSPLRGTARSGSARGAPAIPRRAERPRTSVRGSRARAARRPSPSDGRPASGRADTVDGATGAWDAFQSRWVPGSQWASDHGDPGQVAVTRQPMRRLTVGVRPMASATRRRSSSPCSRA